VKIVRELIAVAGLVFAAAVVGDFYSRLPERLVRGTARDRLEAFQ
jgi:hypothetical protein